MGIVTLSLSTVFELVDAKKKGGSKRKNKKGCIDIPKETCEERAALGKGCTWNGSSCEFDCSYYTKQEDCTHKKRGNFCKWDSDSVTCIKKELVSTMFGAVDASSCKEITDEYECNDVVKGASGVTKQCEWNREKDKCEHLSCAEKTD